MVIKYLDSKRLEGVAGDLTSPSLTSGTGGWKEVGRTTLGSANANILVDSLPDKRYYMILYADKGQASTGADVNIRLNGDANANYSYARCGNGGSNNTDINTASSYGIWAGSAVQTPIFGVFYLANKSDKTKLWQGHSVTQHTAGANNDPERSELVTKWANTSSVVSSITANGTSNLASGSEVVVLGWDDSDTHTTNFWEELSSTSLSGSAGFLNSSQFTAKKYLWFQAYLKNSGSIQLEMKFGHGGNITTELEYASRISINGGTDDASRVSKNSIQTEKNTSSPIFVNGFIVNNASNEKLCIMHEVIQNTAGSSTAPERVEFVGKWTDTTNQIDIIQMTDSGSGSFDTGSIIKVWGSN